MGWKGTRVAVPAWHIQDDAFGDGKQRSKGELIWLCQRKMLDPAFGERGWQGWGIPSWVCRSPKTNSLFLERLGDCAWYFVSLLPFLPLDFRSEGNVFVCMQILGMWLEQVP